MPLRTLAFLLATTAAAAQTPFCTQLQTLTQEPTVAQAHWGVSVTTLDGTSLCGVHDAQLFRPASNAKLFTTTAALALLGPEYTFTTRLVASGPIAGGVLEGDLRLLGDGDAFLSQRPMPYTPPATSPDPTPALKPGAPRLASETWDPQTHLPPDPLAAMADAVAGTGLHHITGVLSAEADAWPAEPFAPDWAIDDAVWGYGAPISALSVYDNKLALTVHPGPTVGSPATVSFERPIELAGQQVYQLDLRILTVAAHSPAALNIERTPGSNLLHLYGTIAQGKPYTDDIAIAEPPAYAGLTLKSLLQARGVQVDGGVVSLLKAPTTATGFLNQAKEPLPTLAVAKPRPPAPLCPTCTVLSTHTSPPLLDDVTLTLKVSQNLHAELLFHHLGEAFADDGSGAQSARVVRQFALNAGLNPADFLLYDGSGLSGHDLVAPRAFTQLLAYAARQPWFSGFKAALPTGGVDGSLAARFPGSLKGRVFAKTGTLGESRALSGYLTTTSGTTLIFSILVDNHTPATAADRIVMDKIVDTIASYNDSK